MTDPHGIGAPQTAPIPTTPFLQTRNIVKRFGRLLAVDDVSIEIGKGEFVCVLGPSGCGKTTLLRIVAGLESQDGGSVLLKGCDITAEPPARRHCGIVFQSYALFPNLTAAQNVAYGLKKLPGGRTAVKARVQEMLDLMGLGDIGGKYPSQLSGGQQQRTALARALAPSPSLLLLDEPLSALDARVRVRLRAEMRALQRRLGITTLMVTHDQEEALTMADRILVMKDGELIQDAHPRAVYDHPADPFVADFIGAMNFLGEWTVGAANTLHHRGLSLQGTDDLPFPEGDCVVAAIRPEHVQLANGSGTRPNAVEGRAVSVEFRGSVYRLRVRVDMQEGEPMLLEADLQASALEGAGIGEGAPVSLHLPPERLLSFQPQDAEASR